MNALNAVLVKVMSGVLTPFLALPAQAALLVLSVVAGVLAAIAFRYTSNQNGLKRVADKIRASMLALLLYREDLGSVLRAQGGLLAAAGLRLWYSIPPLIVLIVPFILLLTHLAMWYEFRPLVPGETTLVEARLTPAAWDGPAIELVTPDVVSVEGSVRDALERRVTWRIRANEESASPHPLLLNFVCEGKKVADKQLCIHADAGADQLLFVSPLRPDGNFGDRLLYPGESAFNANSPIQSIAVHYPPRTNTLFGFKIHWLVTFFVVSIVGALLCKPIVKVQF